MTEQEKAFGRKMIIGSLVTMLVLLCLAIVWQKLNEPMQPQVVGFGNHYEVRWGNRFHPFVYRSFIDNGAEETLCQPSDAQRCLVLGRLFLDAHLYPEKLRKA